MLYKYKKKVKSEEGQSMIEFVLVLPILLFLITLMFDFGWMFYNQIGLENSARNAARVACVEYSDVCLQDNGSYYIPPRREFDYVQISQTNKGWVPVDSDDDITEMEQRILYEVETSIPRNLEDTSVFIEYTYDIECIENGGLSEFNWKNRSDGDVKVYVQSTLHTISPFTYGTVREDGKPSMDRTLTCKSVYKVEKVSSVEEDTNG